jgi:hypothetical protein
LLLIFKWFVNIFLASFMASIYHAPGDTIWGKAFLLVSEQAAAAPLENYQHRLISLFTAFLLAAILLYPLLAGTLLIKNAAKSTRLFSSDFWKLFGGLVLNLNAKLVRLVFNRFFLLALAGVILGFTMSTRFLAGVSAGIVALYFIYKASWKALPPLVVYAALGVVTMYATWPFLWPDLIDRFSEAARVMTRFPDDRDILFAGQVMGSKSLPASYLPTLFSLKFTEPLVIFFVVGIVLLLFKKVWREYVNDRLLLALCLAWFILPFTYFVIAKPNLYDNIRHVIFITPPLAIIAALGIKAFLAKLKTLPLKTGLVLFVFLPSLYSLVNLHPYQYIYFNAFTGGVQGAFRKYELDYWASSYKEAVEFLNDTAEDNARVSVFGPYYIAQLYQRPDLRIDKGDRQPTLEGHDYVIMYTRANWDLYYDVQGEVVYTVNIGDAVLAYVYKLK